MDVGSIIIGTVIITICVICLILTIVWYIQDKRDTTRYFQHWMARHPKEPQPQQPKEKPWCGNCKHTDKSFDDEPCCYCDNCEEWEAQE